LPANKNRLFTNTIVSDTIVSDTTALTFESGEHVNITATTDITITLPEPVAQNIGARFTIFKTGGIDSTVTIQAVTGQNILYHNTANNTYSMGTSIYYITFVCINTSGNTWVAINQG